MNGRDDLAHTAAVRYYLQEQTMDAVAKELSVSRATVSRLLKHARETGIVRIHIEQPEQQTDQLSSSFSELFGVRALVVPVRTSAAVPMRVEQVSRVAADLLRELMGPGTILGVAWGSTVTELSRHLQPRRLSDTIVVQLNGAGNATRTGIPYTGAILNTVAEAFGSQVVHFPVPAFFDYAETKQAMWRERSIRGVLALQREAHLAVFGVGAIQGSVPSHVYSSGYFEEQDYASIARDRVAGDVCTVLLREDGSWADIAMNARASGPTPRELAGIDRRLCVAADPQRAPALLGALRAGAITDLVVDQITAHLVMDSLRPRTTGPRPSFFD